MRVPVLMPLFLLLLTLTNATAANLVWRFSNPHPHGNNILEMRLQDGLVWQIGDRGQVYTSSDLDTWFPHNTGSSLSLRGLTFFGGKAFISTEAGGILSGTSPDDFTLVDLKTSNWLEGISASSSTLVAVGDNGSIYSTADGTRWTPRGNFTTSLRSVDYGANQFVAVGEDGFLATSSDGATWIEKTLTTTAHLNKVAYLNDRFWVVGDQGTVLTNNFRMTFVPVKVGVTNTFFAVAGSSNEVVIAGDGAVLLGNLQTGSWSQQADANSATLAPIWPYYSALWDGRLFLLGGRTGMKVEGFRTNSAAPLGWYAEPQPTRNWLWSAARSAGFYAACGVDGTILTSLDGLDWSREVVPSEASTQVFLGIGGNTNTLVAVGSGGTILRSQNILTNTVTTGANGQPETNQSTLFGVLWEKSISPTANDLQAVAANQTTLLVAGGKGTLLTSADGRTWQSRSSGVASFLSGAASWTQGWIVTGASGVILSSADSISWRGRNSGVTNWVYSVRYIGGKLIAVGESGLILTSTDGTQWTRRASGTSEWLNDVTFAAGTWYIAGSSGLVLTSTDSISWTVTRSSTSKSLYSAVTDGDQLIMTGLEGVIIRAQLAPILTPVNISSFGVGAGESVLLFTGVADQRFVLEAKVRLQDQWSPMAHLEIVESGGTLLFELPHDSSQSLFYRTRLLA
ncbi:MAG TPA: hypothetical protein VK633_14235, partial [Verrucomicrobiae bacterium]|nr:hypothetical protein [Verrucomicrobiae bacterium]